MKNKTNEEYKRFDNDVRAKAKANNITIYKGRGQLVNCPGDSMRVLGFFCDETRRLHVATGCPPEMFIGVYVHESCHMDQWIDGSKYWPENIGDDYMIWSAALDGEDVSESSLQAALSNIVMLEADCERRAVEKIKQYDLPVDLDKYIQLANAYLYFHTAMAKFKKWYKPQNSPGRVGVSNPLPKVLYEPEHYRIGNHNVDPDIFLPCFRD